MNNGERKKHVAVLMGGMSSEHDVSLNSGAMVLQSIPTERYRVTKIVISREGMWHIDDTRPRPMHEVLAWLRVERVDCVFIALHGPFGEDGRLQGMFDLLRIPYVGSGCAASALALDKLRSKAVVRDAGILVAKQTYVQSAQWQLDATAITEHVTTALGYPCVIKCPTQGSSLGMAIPRGAEEFQGAMYELLPLEGSVLIEQFLAGKEVTCAVLDDVPGAEPVALPVTEIVPVTSAFFDYKAKYTPGATEEITPARISDELTRAVQEVAVRVHKLVGCSGLSRSDFILVDDRPVWLEVNTIPGMTGTSLFPQAAAAAGISFPDLVERLVEGAMAAQIFGAEKVSQS
jgi:D-alanine-D-alanine ligase